MKHSVFLYPPLSDAAFIQSLPDAEIVRQNVVLHDFSLCRAGISDIPSVVYKRGASVEGTLTMMSDTGRARLDGLFGLFGAQAGSVRVQIGDTETQALTYRFLECDQRNLVQPAALWNAEQTEIMRLAIVEMLELVDHFPKAALRARWPMALSHAASQMRARKGGEPARQRKNWNRSDVDLVHGKTPYAWYFAVAEHDLCFRQFDGAFSQTVKRAGLVMCDAVTVLPYDPRRDVVMVIEQFRFGPWLRGACNAWLLEPVAGRVDPFERPEDCALRETLEEAQITLREEALFPVGHVYPSPGAITEFLYQYVAVTDLPDGSEGISGLDSEAEDIRSHIIPFARLMELIQTGEVVNGPLVQSAYWLALNRDRLRADAADQPDG